MATAKLWLTAPVFVTWVPVLSRRLTVPGTVAMSAVWSEAWTLTSPARGQERVQRERAERRVGVRKLTRPCDGGATGVEERVVDGEDRGAAVDRARDDQGAVGGAEGDQGERHQADGGEQASHGGGSSLTGVNAHRRCC